MRGYSGRHGVSQLDKALAGCVALDWKVQDVVIIAVSGLLREVVGDD